MEDAEAVAKPTKIQFILMRLRRIVVTLALLAIIWGVVRYMMLPSLINQNTQPQNSISSEQLQALESRINEVEAQLVALKENATAPAQTVDLSPLEARLAALENKPAPEIVPTITTPSVSNEELVALKNEIETLKKADHAYVRSIILFGQLQESLRAGKPYALELKTLQDLRPELKDLLAPLAENAAIGIATYEQLLAQFKSAITPALSPDDTQKSLSHNLRSLVKIRKIGEEQQDADDEAILARAEARLKKGAVADAIKETQSLSPNALAAFSAWQDNAKAHLAALDALEEVNQALAQGAKP